MRTILFFLALLAVTGTDTARAQEADAPDGTRVAAADVSGIPVEQLSATLRADIEALVGTAIASERLAALVARIEDEKPDVVAAVRRTLQPGGEAHVTFVVAHTTDDPELLANINSRYVIESVSVVGSVHEEVEQPIRDQLDDVVGKRLDPGEAERLTQLLASNLPRFSGFEVTRRFERGSRPGQIRLIFVVSLSSDWGKDFVMLGGPLGIPRQPKIVYHAYQGWSALVNFPITIERNTLTFGVAVANEDDLIEQYSGFRFRFGRKHVGTDRLGVSVDVSRFTQAWRESTLSAVDADPSIPAAYDMRITFEPRVTVKPIPRVTLTGGLLLASLDPIGPGASTADSAVILAASSGQQWIIGGARHSVSGAYELHTASSDTSSDYDYTRHHRITAGYDYTQGQNGLHVKWLFGRARGEVPLFERFALGDTNTLRGWNKFDLSPAGGTRMFHQSIEYRYRIMGVFLDAGSVWTGQGQADVKYAVGAGLQDFRGFVTVAVPLQTDDRRVVFMMGVRFLSTVRSARFAWTFGFVFAAGLELMIQAAPQPMTMTVSADAVHVRVPELRVLQGRVLGRLRDGGSARLVLGLLLYARRDGVAVAQTEQTFIVSFDLWEERFSVTRVGRPARTVSHLTSSAAEAWCVDNVTVPMTAFGADRPAMVWARIVLNVRTEPAVRVEPENGLSIRRLIDAFSPRATEEEPMRSLEGGPFTLTN